MPETPSQTMPTTDDSADAALRSNVDRCVRCGLCLPECPTYRLAADENASPRGRLALIEGLLHGRIGVDDAVIGHLDGCLGCRRCERVCPSLVPYGHVLDAARARLPAPGRRRLARLLQRPRWQRAAAAIARRIPVAASRPLPALHRLHAMAHALPVAGRAPAPGLHRALTTTTRGRVGLVAGCSGHALQPAALAAATLLLRRAGYDVELPAATGCCGALAAHAGDAVAATAAAAATRARFDGELAAIVSIASGCGVHLDAYAPPLASAHCDICRFLVDAGTLAPGDFAPLPRRVAMHVPCSVENVYRGAAWARRLLELLPAVEVVEIGERGQCCGAAGDYMLRHPEAATRLRRPLLDALAHSGADVLVSGNVGCALHIAAGVRGQGTKLEILHPVELVARQLR